MTRVGSRRRRRGPKGTGKATNGPTAIIGGVVFGAALTGHDPLEAKCRFYFIRLDWFASHV